MFSQFESGGANESGGCRDEEEGLLTNGPYKLDGANVKVQEYRGDDLQHILSKGIFKLTIIGMEVDLEAEMYRYARVLFQEFECTNINIHNINDQPSGLVYLRFMTDIGRRSAMDLVKGRSLIGASKLSQARKRGH
nr:hypothetical protein [Tanacetum cinerariifolium]